MQFSDTETKIFNLLENTINFLGFDLVLISLVSDSMKTLKVIIDSKDGAKLSINECKQVSKAITPILDVEGIIDGKYLIEVSSAGLERPLVKKTDYIRFIGRQILVKLRSTLDDRKKYEGKLLEVNDDSICLQIDILETFLVKKISFDIIKSANLVMTDEIFKAILKS